MYLRDNQFHKTNPKLAAVFQTIFDDLIVAKENVGNVNTEIYSYDKYVRDTIVTVFILRAEITDLLKAEEPGYVPEVETLGFCYPRELEQKIIDASISKKYETVFNVPNGLKDLATVEIRNLRLLSPQFAEMYERYFTNEHFYILNRYSVQYDPKIVFAEPAEPTPEQIEADKQYDYFCLKILPKYEKAKKSLITEIGKILERVPATYGRFKVKRKVPLDITVTSGAALPEFNASDFEERKVDHDLFYTLTGELITSLDVHPLANTFMFIESAFIHVPHHMKKEESRVLTPIPFSDLDESGLTLDEDLHEVIGRIQNIVDTVNYMVYQFVMKWGDNAELIEKTMDTLNLFIHIASRKQDLLYKFNDRDIVEKHLNDVFTRIEDIKKERGVEVAEWGIDPNSCKLWDYTDPAVPVEIPELDLDGELAENYSESYTDMFLQTMAYSGHPLVRTYQVIKPVAEEHINDHAIGSVRQG